MDEYSYEFKVPKERIAIVIGAQGKTKKKIEQQSEVHIDVDSKEGEIKLTATDMLKLYVTKDIITAIGRGFNPEIALQLIKPENVFEQISLVNIAKTPKELQRMRGRLIGTDGKARRHIEELTDCSVSVFGKTVSIVGNVEMIGFARKAVEMLVKGSQHQTVYAWMEKQRRILKERRMREIL